MTSFSVNFLFNDINIYHITHGTVKRILLIKNWGTLKSSMLDKKNDISRAAIY